MKKTFIIVTAVNVAACSNGDGNATAPATAATEIDAATATATAISTVPGTAGVPEKSDDKGERRWIVPVTFGSESTVNVEIERSTGAVDEISAEEGPFDYDIPVNAGFIPYKQAKDAAGKAKPGDLQQWEVKPPEAQYEFYMRDSNQVRWEVKLDATTGNVMSTITKDRPD